MLLKLLFWLNIYLNTKWTYITSPYLAYELKREESTMESYTFTTYVKWFQISCHDELPYWVSLLNICKLYCAIWHGPRVREGLKETKLPKLRFQRRNAAIVLNYRETDSKFTTVRSQNIVTAWRRLKSAPPLFSASFPSGQKGRKKVPFSLLRAEKGSADLDKIVKAGPR